MGDFLTRNLKTNNIHLLWFIPGILQFRPDFTYLDKSSKRKKETAAAEAASDDEEAGPSSVRQVTVKFKQLENNERKKKAIETSFKTLQKKSEAEAWTPYTWHTQDSTFSEVSFCCEIYRFEMVKIVYYNKIVF